MEFAQTLFDRYRLFLQSRVCTLCGSDRLKGLPTDEKYGFPIQIVLCRRCGLLFFNPMWSTEGYSRFYQHDYRLLTETIDNGEERVAAQRAFGQWLVDQGLKEIAQFAPHSKVLEIGCDQGGLLALLRETCGVQVVGVEPNEVACGRARALGIPVLQQAFDGSEFDSETFDLVILARTLNHVVQPVGTLRSVYRLVKPGGFLYVDVPDVVRASSFLKVDAQIDHPFMYGEGTARLLLHVSGFRVVRFWQIRKRYVVQLRFLAQKTERRFTHLEQVPYEKAGGQVRRRFLINTVKTPLATMKNWWIRTNGV